MRKRTVFISYSSKDKNFAEKLAADLRASGAGVWFDQWEIKVGDSITQKINDGIHDNDYLVVILSPASVASPWVRKELNAAMMKELNRRSVVVLPILYRVCEIPALIADKHYADFRKSYEAGFSEILRVLAPDQEGVRLRPAPARPRQPVNWEKVGAIAGVIAVLIALGVWLVPNAADFLSAWLSKTPTATPTTTPTTVAAVTKPPTDTPLVTPTSSPTHTPVTSTAKPTNTPFLFAATPTFTPTPPTPTKTPTPMPPTAMPVVPTPTPHLTGKIAYVMSDGIWVMDADGSNRRRVYEESVNALALSPDGNKIAFIRRQERGSTGDLWVMDVNGSGIQQIVDSEAIRSVAWAPDSNQIVYFEWAGVAGGASYIVKIPGGVPQTLGYYMYDPAWSPDGGWFAYHGSQGLVKQPVSGGSTFVLDSSTNWDAGPAWSPDGTRIAYMKNGDIFVINADGSGQMKLTDNPALDRYPSWSPDGTKIVFSTNRDGNDEIYVMNPDGSNQMNLTNSAKNEWRPSWAR